ncbi:MAG: hypothetical protein ACJAQ0_000982, partial [Dasania sp.]
RAIRLCFVKPFSSQLEHYARDGKAQAQGKSANKDHQTVEGLGLVTLFYTDTE